MFVEQPLASPGSPQIKMFNNEDLMGLAHNTQNKKKYNTIYPDIKTWILNYQILSTNKCSVISQGKSSGLTFWFSNYQYSTQGILPQVKGEGGGGKKYFFPYL